MADDSSMSSDAILSELLAIKRLMAFSLLRAGASQAEVAIALGTSQSQVSRMFPNGTVRREKKSQKGK